MILEINDIVYLDTPVKTYYKIEQIEGNQIECLCIAVEYYKIPFLYNLFTFDSEYVKFLVRPKQGKVDFVISLLNMCLEHGSLILEAIHEKSKVSAYECAKSAANFAFELFDNCKVTN